MNILLTAATPGEIQTTREYLAEKMYYRKNCNTHVLITGAGMVNTIYALTKYISANRPHIVIQAGIGGSLHPFYPPGAVVMIREEVMGDLGVEEGGEFSDIFDLNLAEENIFPFSGRMLTNPHRQLMERIKLPAVRGVSINEITTGAARMQQLIEKYGAVIESMEGAALHYVCLQEAVPFIQLRAVSNFVGERDKTKWRMQEAIDHLNRELIVVMHQFLNQD
ncbi:futalosine hydrolase [Agriterribacter sp.]|uniref:futalosine hydrolase n=1 Tax=Agriterribacter sp. TaxID=2821509 RepID=UPI002C8D3E0F|nr:futalosine hydrolase [Agriterribacter sp.]HRO46442.1 futalosine hydrolase [Agriterribacter sp.]HRQ17341.1 futalosine hydrolase [Agriterribacter sp.]